MSGFNACLTMDKKMLFFPPGVLCRICASVAEHPLLSFEHYSINRFSNFSIKSLTGLLLSAVGYKCRHCGKPCELPMLSAADLDSGRRISAKRYEYSGFSHTECSLL